MKIKTTHFNQEEVDSDTAFQPLYNVYVYSVKPKVKNSPLDDGLNIVCPLSQLFIWWQYKTL